MIEFERLINYLLNQFLVYTQNSPLIFNSGIFLVLFLILYGGYTFLYKNDSLRIIYLIAFSFFFYYKSSGGFVFLLAFSAIFNWLSGILINSFQLKKNKKIALWITILINVGLLFYFKYTFFFLQTESLSIGSQVTFTDCRRWWRRKRSRRNYTEWSWRQRLRKTQPLEGSVFVTGNMSATSPQKFVIFIILKHFFWDQSIQKIIYLLLQTKSLRIDD